MFIELENHEILFAAQVGITRRIKSMSRARDTHNTIGNPNYGWHIDVEAACAEMAFAKFLGVYWDASVDTFKKPDVGDIQVRSTSYDSGSLIFRDGDNEEDKFALVTGVCPKFAIRGWAFGTTICVEKYAVSHQRKEQMGWPVDQAFWMMPSRDLESMKLLYKPASDLSFTNKAPGVYKI